MRRGPDPARIAVRPSSPRAHSRGGDGPSSLTKPKVPEAQAGNRFLNGLEQRRQRYVVAVRADFAVAEHRAGGMARRADAMIGAQPSRSWRTVTWPKPNIDTGGEFLSAADEP